MSCSLAAGEVRKVTVNIWQHQHKLHDRSTTQLSDAAHGNQPPVSYNDHCKESWF